MHELSIAEALIEQVEREVERAGQVGRVTKIELSIGRLTGVHADSLLFAFGLLAPGTRVEKAEVKIREPQAVCVCQACGRRTEIAELVIDCPVCRSGEVVIDGGRDLLLESIEVED